MRHLVTLQAANGRNMTVTVDARTMTGASNRALRRAILADEQNPGYREPMGWRVLAVDTLTHGWRLADDA